MKRLLGALSMSSWFVAGVAAASSSMVSVDIVAPDGRLFQEIPMQSRDGALRSYLQAEKGARYQVRVHNASGERLGLVIAVDGRNIIDGKKSELARGEPMYVLDAWGTDSYAGWRANLDAVNEFYFTDWADSYAEAFGDRSARGVIAVAVYREAPPPTPVYQPRREDEYASRGEPLPAPPPAATSVPQAADSASQGRSAGSSERRDKSAGTGHGERRVDRVQTVEFVPQTRAESRHFVKYEWRETLCRKRLLECTDSNRFWDESVLGFAPPPPRRR